MCDRDEFERVFKSVFKGHKMTRGANGDYVSIVPWAAWKVWQAARQAPASGEVEGQARQFICSGTGPLSDASDRYIARLILRKQAEAVEEAYKSTVLSTKGDHPQYEKGFDDAMNQYDGQMEKYVELLRQQSDEAEKAGG